MTEEHGEATQRLSLDEDLTIYHAVGQKEQLMAALAGCDELELDLSQVSEIDTSGFQLLILTKREAIRQGKTPRLVLHSAAVREVLDIYNAASFFGDPMHIPAKGQA
jgi:ABC-type transporter Mla MlaB component